MAKRGGAMEVGKSVFGTDDVSTKTKEKPVRATPVAPAVAAAAAATPAPAAAAAAASEGGAAGGFTGGQVSGKVDAKFTKKKDERDIRFGSTDPGLFGSTFEATGKGMPKRGGAAATNDR